jgi:hypothetical protein
MIRDSTIAHRSNRVLSQQVGDTNVLLDPDSGEYFSLDEVGARIWELCDGRRTADAIAAALGEEYEADVSAIRADVVRLLTELHGAKLIDVH